MNKHTVEKIGGTSMSNFALVLENILLRPQQLQQDLYNRIFILSAYGGVTNQLLENKKTGAPGVYGVYRQGDSKWEPLLEEVLGDLKKHNQALVPLGLDVKKADDFISERVEGTLQCLNELQHICSYGHFQIETYLPAIREMLSSLGEAHSTYNSTLILQSQGINSRFVDLTGWKEEDTLPFEKKVSEAFEQIDLANELPMVTGYVKCSEGLMAKYDRGYSEITFSQIATLTGAKEGIIHKEYHLSSADPVLLGPSRVKIIGRTNFDVADQLADLGMEAIHPKASKGMEIKGIPLRVKNTFEPDHEGTVIGTNQFVSEDPKVEIIAGVEKMLGLEVMDPDMVGQIGYDYQLLGFLQEMGISYIAKNTNANTISHYVFEKNGKVKVCAERIKNHFPTAQVHLHPVSIISIIGSNMNTPGVIGLATSTLANDGINILACNQCMRQVNIQLIVERKDFQQSISLLHQVLVEQGSPFK